MELLSVQHILLSLLRLNGFSGTGNIYLCQNRIKRFYSLCWLKQASKCDHLIYASFANMLTVTVLISYSWNSSSTWVSMRRKSCSLAAHVAGVWQLKQFIWTKQGLEEEADRFDRTLIRNSPEARLAVNRRTLSAEVFLSTMLFCKH